MQLAGIYDNTISTIFIISFEKPKSTIACWTSNFIKRNNTIPCDTTKIGITTNCKRKNIVFIKLFAVHKMSNCTIAFVNFYFCNPSASNNNRTIFTFWMMKCSIDFVKIAFIRNNPRTLF